MTPNASLPTDVEAVRATTARLLAEDAELSAVEEVYDLTLLYRGHLMVLIPEVEKAACGMPRYDSRKTAALAGVREAQVRLEVPEDVRLPRQIAHAQRLGRSVVCLLDHLKALSGGSS